MTNLKKIDHALIIGSSLFGLGWGISGYCPGPAIALLAAPNWEFLVFIPTMLLGYAAQRYLSKPTQTQPSPVKEAQSDKDEPSACG